MEAKKAEWLRTHASLKCEVCKFDFNEHYGDHDFGYTECHRMAHYHDKLLSLKEMQAMWGQRAMVINA